MEFSLGITTLCSSSVGLQGVGEEVLEEVRIFTPGAVDDLIVLVELEDVGREIFRLLEVEGGLDDGFLDFMESSF